MKSANRYIKFEIETRMAPFGMFGGAGTGKEDSDEDYTEATEEDIMLLARALGGG